MESEVAKAHRKARQREYYRKHRDKMLAYSRRYIKDHPEKVKEYQQRYNRKMAAERKERRERISQSQSQPNIDKAKSLFRNPAQAEHLQWLLNHAASKKQENNKQESIHQDAVTS